MELKGYILEKAKEAGICKEWANKIARCSGSPSGLLSMYVKGIDFCLENNFPSNDDLVRFGGKALKEYGIYVDDRAVGSDYPFLVLLGQSTAKVEIFSFQVSQIFVKHKSVAEIYAQDNAFVVIDCFDQTDVRVFAMDDAKVLLNVYGNAKATYQSEGNGVVKMVNKLKKGY